MEQIQMVQIERLHPHERNPRLDVARVAELMESIRENGIRVPLVLAPREGAEGEFTVIAGASSAGGRAWSRAGRGAGAGRWVADGSG